MVLEEPRRGADVFGPDETVPQNLLIVGGGKGDEGVGLVEIELVLLWLDVVHFHAIGRGEDVELGSDQLQFFRGIIVGEFAIKCNGEIEAVFVGSTKRGIGL